VQRLLASLLLGLLTACEVAASGASTPAQTLPTTRAEARIEGRAVPDIPLQLADGHERTLFELGDERALLVTFFYRRCTGVCTPFLQWVADATTEVGGLGTDYRVLALSFDEADTAGQLRAQARALGLLESADWHFAVASQADVAEIAGALDFWYRRQVDTEQFDHDSLLVAVRNGRVIRALNGGPGQTQRLRELVWELRGRVMPYYPVKNEPAVRCVSFDARSGELHIDWGMLLLVAPALVALTATLVLFRSRGARS